MQTRMCCGASMAAFGVLMLAGCAQSVRNVTLEDLRKDGRLPAVKPAGMVLEEEHEREAGPPPFEYIRIVGNAMPDWTPFAERGTFMSWEFLGPRPMSSEYWSYEGNAGGRIAGIAPHPTDVNTCWIATATGGVWKTTNGGTNWTPLTDELSILNCGSIAVSASNPLVLYLGTGDYVGGTSGDGIFKSIDGGINWTRMATTAQVGTRISKIAVNPTNPDIVVATTSTGTYRTANGGTTWSARIVGNSSNLSMAASNPNVVYAGVRSVGVYRSTDGGQVFTRLAGGLPTTGFTHVDVAVSSSNTNVAYAAFVNGGGILGMWRTADGGTTWTQKTATPNFPNPQGGYNSYVCVDPSNENTLYVGGVDPRYATTGIARSLDGGDTWTEISGNSAGVHPDHHVMTFGPGPTIWEGNDGGIYKSSNGGANWVNLNATLAAAQVYSVAIHPTQLERALGGTQDNGTPERPNSVTTTWPQLQVGDGGYSVYDFATTGRRYTTYVYLAVTRWNNSSGAGITGGWTADPTNFIAPLVGDPNSATTLLGGTNRVWRTTNASAASVTWTALSAGSIAGTGTLNAIAVAPGNSNVIYTGASTGVVQVTQNLTTWTDRSAGLPTGQVSDIVIHPANPGTAYVSFYNTSGGRIYRTTNFGANWTNMTGTLPSGASVTSLAVDFGPRVPVIFAGSGAGVYASTNGGGTWIKDDASLPNVNVSDLQIYPNQRVIVAGTYGRGVWRAALPPSCPADINGDGVQDFFDYLDFVSAFSAGSAAADFNADGVIDLFDYLDFVDQFSMGCGG